MRVVTMLLIFLFTAHQRADAQELEDTLEVEEIEEIIVTNGGSGSRSIEARPKVLAVCKGGW